MNLHQIAAVTLVVGFTVLGIHNVADNQNKLHIQNIQVKSKNAELKSLELKYDSLQIELNKTDSSHQEKIKQLELEKQKLEQERQRLEGELQAKKASKLQTASTSVPFQGTASASPNCGSDPYMAQIYMRESGCRTTALNSIGCYGIGQSCPASKIAHCGADFACQDAWFKAYAIARYGSYANAWAQWQIKHWW